MISNEKFVWLRKENVEIVSFEKMKMKINAYILKIKQIYEEVEIDITFILILEKRSLNIFVYEIIGSHPQNEQFRLNISLLIHALVSDLKELPEYRFHFLYNRIQASVFPPVFTQHLSLYEKRINEKEYVQQEADLLIGEMRKKGTNFKLPSLRKTRVYFKRIIVYGYDGMALVDHLEEKCVICHKQTKKGTYPNYVFEFTWNETESINANRENELVKLWFSSMVNAGYCCELLLNNEESVR